MTVMAVERLLPTKEAADLIALTRDVADKLLTPIVDEHEKAETYPEGVFAQLGTAGLLSLSQPEEWGGGGQPFEVYLQVLEEIAARWAAVAVAVSVHSLSCHPLLMFGSDEQKKRWLRGMLSGEQIGAYSLWEPQAGSDAAAPRCTAKPTPMATSSTAQSRGSPTAGAPTFTRCSPHRRRLARGVVLPDPRRSARSFFRQARGQDGPVGGADHVAVL
jgi:hypothetical protein